MPAVTLQQLIDAGEDVQVIDDFANSPAATVTTREGTELPTLQGLVATVSEEAVVAAALDAAAARDAANTSGRVYADTTAGIAGTTNGQTFSIFSGSYIIQYRNDAGAATEVGRFYVKAYIDSAIPGAPVGTSRVPLVEDEVGNVAVWLEDGLLAAMGLSEDLVAAIQEDVGIDAVPSGSGMVPLFTDEDEQVPLWLENGLLDGLGFGSTLAAEIEGMAAAAVNLRAPANSPTSSELPNVTDGRSLYSWRTKLAQILRGTTVAQAKIIVMGDSWAERLPIPQALADILYAAYTQKSGEGWIALFDVAPLNAVAVTSSGWTTYDGSDTTAPASHCGFDGKALIATGTAATYGITNLTTTDLAIYYVNGNGTFRWRVDGGAWTAVAGTGTGAIAKVSITGLSNTTHTVDIDLTGNTGTVTLCGFRATCPAVKGVEVSKAGNGSLTGADLAMYVADNVATYMADILPDVVLVILGTNDARLSESTPTEYIAALTTLVAQVRSTSPNTAFIFVAPPDNAVAEVEPLTDYRDALYEFCVGNGYEFYNMYDEWSDYTTMNALGAWADTLHLNDDGGYALAKRLHTKLLAL
ncbi:MAG: hypothetical protein K0R58_231 [Ramlibacter sp.]|jgi:lysophospholipase L1-like esterase|nr:hypothetical protein [Ramlibacter sp.]